MHLYEFNTLKIYLKHICLSFFATNSCPNTAVLFLDFLWCIVIEDIVWLKGQPTEEHKAAVF